MNKKKEKEVKKNQHVNKKNFVTFN